MNDKREDLSWRLPASTLDIGNYWTSLGKSVPTCKSSLPAPVMSRERFRLFYRLPRWIQKLSDNDPCLSVLFSWSDEMGADNFIMRSVSLSLTSSFSLLWPVYYWNFQIYSVPLTKLYHHRNDFSSLFINLIFIVIWVANFLLLFLKIFLLPIIPLLFSLFSLFILQGKMKY